MNIEIWKFDLRHTDANRALRVILAPYVGLKPDQIAFDYLPSGKPVLDNLFFNMSHSAHVALIAVSRDCPIGVDLERIRPVQQRLRIAERFFSPPEFGALQSLEASEQNLAFLKLWTAKEAQIKALGLQLTDYACLTENSCGLRELQLEGFVAHLAFQSALPLLETDCHVQIFDHPSIALL